jgi:predicted acetyltransferase
MLEPINESNFFHFDKLVQDYEVEFSSFTGKTPNQDGKYSIDVDWQAPNKGYYWKEGSQIIGFCIIETIDTFSELVDFYVVPAHRKKMIGRKMALAVFNKHCGPWQVRQILDHELAKKFWRKVIGDYTKENYTELQIDDPLWGSAVFQRFNNSPQ